jgi:hypothetical protein
MKNKNIQQGDVLLLSVDSLPKGERKSIARGRIVVAHGESGHSHVIEDDEAELIQIGDRMLLSLTRKVTIQHQEHKPVTLTPGIWEVGQVRQKNWFTEMVSPVRD